MMDRILELWFTGVMRGLSGCPGEILPPGKCEVTFSTRSLLVGVKSLPRATYSYLIGVYNGVLFGGLYVKNCF